MDRSADPAQAPRRLAELRGELDGWFAGAVTSHHFSRALVAAIQRFHLEKEPFEELLEGLAKDEGRVRVGDWDELERYCYQVASVVGLIMARIFELKSEAGRRHAIELGIAMQLTNILRDVGEDLERDRIYLPAEDLRRFGVTEADLRQRLVSAEFVQLMRMQIERAREFYRASEAGIPLLADDGSQYSVWLMRCIYAGILPEIERLGFDVFSRRATTSFWSKLRLAALAWRRYRQTRA